MGGIFEHLGLPLLAFAGCALLHTAALRYFPKWNLLDFPERYGLKRGRLPYPTGILAVLTFVLSMVPIPSLSFQAWGVIAAVGILGLYSFVDDRRQLPVWVRLSVQVLVAIIVFTTGSRIYTITNPFEAWGLGSLIKLDTIDIPTAGFGPLPLWSGIFTVVWLGLTINALNWFDGIPGQVSTLSVIGFITIGLLAGSERVDQDDLALIAYTLAGISMACLLFDFPPPRVVLGDSGAMFFGLMLGVLTIYSGGKVATAFLVLGVPLVDSVIVVIRRLAKGRSPFKGNQKDEHLHHRLIAKGWNERQIIALTAGLGTLFGVSALFFSTTEKMIAGVVLLLIMLSLSRYSKPQNT